jgi:hypothetical protein
VRLVGFEVAEVAAHATTTAASSSTAETAATTKAAATAESATAGTTCAAGTALAALSTGSATAERLVQIGVVAQLAEVDAGEGTGCPGLSGDSDRVARGEIGIAGE